MFELYMPTETGELLAWLSAVVTVLFGLVLLCAPRLCFRVMRISTVPGHPDAVAAGRGTMAGFYLGVGLSALLLAQPLLYVALGAGWAFTAFGRLVSMVFDRGLNRFNLVSILIEAALAALPLGYSFGLI